ncbi:Multidrug resistance protein abc superfamily, partial [Globisporangium splendens]
MGSAAQGEGHDAVKAAARPVDHRDDESRGSFHELKTPRAASTTPKFAGRTQDDDATTNASPLDSANLLSFTTIWWIQPLLRRGFAAPLQEDNVWELPKADQSQALQTRFDAAWAHERHRIASSSTHPETPASTKPPRFQVALWTATKNTMTLAIVLHLMSATFTVFQPMLIKAILQYLQDKENVFGITSGYGLACLLGTISFCGAIAINSGMFLTARAGCNARMIVINSVYQKILRLSATARRTMNSGEIVTLASVDSERLLEAYSIGLWSVISPIMLTVVCIMIGTQMGVYVGLAGAATIVLIIYLAFTTSRQVGIYRRQIAKVSAERVKVTNEVLQGIRVIKFYGWENSISEKIRSVRDSEIALMRQYNYLRLYNAVLMFLAPSFLNAVCFFTYILLGKTLDVATAFVILALSNACKMPFSIFANATVYVSEAAASTKRISDFLIADEVEDKQHDDDSKCAQLQQKISIRNADFQWLHNAESSNLSDINLTIKPGTLTVIVGTVGSGKSSLINAILGEMLQTRGERDVHGAFAYSSQQPWIQNQTLRENILFGERFDATHYQNVVSACQLVPDFEMLEQGDATEIGERGINLSGGQKARVSIARAMYRVRRCDFLMLDDPLSALDVHVANSVFADGLNGIAKEKTRLLVLNSHYHFLQYADRILVMSGGRIIGDGTLGELRGEFPFLAQSPRKNASTAEGEDDNMENEDDASALERNVKKASKKIATSRIETTGDETKDSKQKKLIVEEDRLIGSVNWRTYVKYLDCCGWNGFVVGITILFLFTIAQVALFFCDWFLSKWSNGAIHYSQGTSLGIYMGLVVVASALVLARCVFYTEMCMRCSANLHFKYMWKVLSAPVTTFFDVTPVGRVLNRFSRDLDQVDNPLPYFSMWMLLYLFQISSAFLVCAATNPYVLILYLPLGFVFVFVTRVYQASARELKRLDGITRSPFLNLVSETIHGIETIRSYKMSDVFLQKCEQLLNHNAKFFFAFQSSSRWFAMRTDWLVSSIITSVALLAVATKESLGAAVAGLGLTYAAQLTSSFQRMTTLVTMTENIMTCFERIAHYESLDAEGYKCSPTNRELLAPEWPRSGSVVFENVTMRYRDDLELVLKNVSFSITSGEKVGVCGRTGSGKSSLMSVLFRVVECTAGRVVIDGVDISTITVQQLRSKLTIIPQDPMLFSGSLRMNLDPFAEKSDVELWEVLRKVHLHDTVSAWGKGLEYEVAEKGDNLSVGQRQLLCIARALIRESKVIVMDEATANVDQESDKLIQLTVKESFGGGNKTVLCIAHRLETILDSDKILVLDAGEVKEFDTPAALLNSKEPTIFQSLVESSKAVGNLDA